jgi:8-oxo-dGTP pyrophosphatase MutT (NUDIX family)
MPSPSSPSSSGAQRAEPRLAATVLVVRDDPFRVLMVRRPATGTFADALVFPGGAVEPDDSAAGWDTLAAGGAALSPGERAIRIAGVRETFEETSLLPAVSAGARAVAASGLFSQALAAAGARLRLDDIHPFAHWITPEVAPRRFDTHFLLVAAPDEGEAVSTGGETVDTEWVEPAVAVARAEEGERAILFPTLLNLMRLGESTDATTAIAAARARQAFTVTPVVAAGDDGNPVVVIPEEAGYAVTRGTPPWMPPAG